MVVVPTAKHMADPLVAKWVLRRIRYAREIDDQVRVDQLEALFDEVTLRRIIQSHASDLVPDVFMNLSTRLFCPLEKYLLKSWPSWKGVVACWSAQKIAELAPHDFRGVLAEFVKSPVVVSDLNRLFGVFNAVASMGKDAADIATILVKRVQPEEDKQTWWYVLPDMVGSAVCTGIINEAIALLIQAFGQAEDEQEKQRMESALSAAYKALVGDLPYFNQILDLSRDRAEQGLADLPALFVEGSPLRMIDAAASKKGRIRLDAALELLPDGRDVAAIVGFSRRLSVAIQDLDNREDLEEMLGNFLLAATAAHYAKDCLQPEGMGLSTLLSVSSYDVAKLPCYLEILNALRRLDLGEVITGMKGTLVKARGHYGGVHLVSMMGDLGYGEFIDPLIECMSRDAGDFISEDAMKSLAKIGSEAVEVIMSRWRDLDYSQRIYGYGVMRHTGGGEPYLRFLQERFSEVRSRPADLEMWCTAVEATPDLHLVEILEKELHRKLAAVDDTFATLCTLLDDERPGLKDARRRIVERQAKKGNQTIPDDLNTTWPGRF
ncbi:MAG: hypothetical protein V1755_07665 [Chloroflexota bacterium]